MHKKLFNSLRGQKSLQILSKSLFVGLLAISSTAAWAQQQKPLPPSSKETPTEIPTEIPKETETLTQPKPAPIPAQTKVNNPAITEKLLGTWEAKNPANPSSSDTVKFIFASAGKMFIVMSPGSNTPVAYETNYKIDSKPKPMHLDVILAGRNEKVLTIFEFTKDDKLKVEVEKSRPGQPRPKNFPANTPIFEKVSKSTNLPKDVKLLGDVNKRQGGNSQSDDPKRVTRSDKPNRVTRSDRTPKKASE